MQLPLQILLLLGIYWLSACNSSQPQQLPAAPLNNKDALEKLANAYESVSETIPVSPISIRPAARKKFVEQVFAKAGYNYSATLHALSEVSADSITQYHKDIKQLLFLPHYRVNFEETKNIYSEEEIKSIKKINLNLK